MLPKIEQQVAQSHIGGRADEKQRLRGEAHDDPISRLEFQKNELGISHPSRVSQLAGSGDHAWRPRGKSFRVVVFRIPRFYDKPVGAQQNDRSYTRPPLNRLGEFP